MFVELLKKMRELRMKSELLQKKMLYFSLVEMLSRKEKPCLMWCQYSQKNKIASWTSLGERISLELMWLKKMQWMKVYLSS